VILLDADVVLIDRKYQNDQRRSGNSAALARLLSDRHSLGMVVHAVMEVVGVMSYGTSTADIPLIPDALKTIYGITIFPDPQVEPDYAGCSYTDLIGQMSLKMSLGDAVHAVQIARFAPSATLLITWNAKHFRGKLAVPALTPEEWLQQQPPAAPASLPPPTGPIP
jgi:arginine utilization protein RocB